METSPKGIAYDTNLPELVRRAEENALYLVLVQPEEAAVQPALTVMDAAANSLSYTVKVDIVWVERAVQMYISSA